MARFRRQQIDPSRLPPHVLQKWSAEALAEGFVPLPKKLLRTMRKIFRGPRALDDLTVVLAIADYLRPRLSRGPSLAYLAFLAGMEENEVSETMKRLQQRGLIGVAGDDQEFQLNLDGLLEAIEAESEELESGPGTGGRGITR